MATYYVATTGNDSRTTTQAQNVATPWLTLNKAKANVVAGDTVIVRGGVYAEKLVSGIPSGTAGNVITWQAFPGETPILRPTFVSGDPRVLYLWQVNYVTFDGLVFDAVNMQSGGVGASCIKFDTDDGTSPPGQSTNITLIRCEITNARASGILGRGTNVLISTCHIHHNGTQPESVRSGRQGIYWEGDNTTVEYCEIDHNNGSGINFWDANVGVLQQWGNVARYNVIHDHHMQTTAINPDYSPGILVATNQASAKADLYNNIIYNNDVGISLQYNFIGGTIANNTITQNTSGQLTGTGWGIELFGPGGYVSGAIIRNNILTGNEQAGLQDNSGGSPYTADHNLTTGDPLFVDATNHNFQLLAGSPAIDAGTTVALVTDDFIHTVRPYGSAYDIGAYEFTPGTVPFARGTQGLSFRSDDRRQRIRRSRPAWATDLPEQGWARKVLVEGLTSDFYEATTDFGWAQLSASFRSDDARRPMARSRPEWLTDVPQLGWIQTATIVFYEPATGAGWALPLASFRMADARGPIRRGRPSWATDFPQLGWIRKPTVNNFPTDFYEAGLDFAWYPTTQRERTLRARYILPWGHDVVSLPWAPPIFDIPPPVEPPPEPGEPTVAEPGITSPRVATYPLYPQPILAQPASGRCWYLQISNAGVLQIGGPTRDAALNPDRLMLVDPTDRAAWQLALSDDPEPIIQVRDLPATTYGKYKDLSVFSPNGREWVVQVTAVGSLTVTGIGSFWPTHVTPVLPDELRLAWTFTVADDGVYSIHNENPHALVQTPTIYLRAGDDSAAFQITVDQHGILTVGDPLPLGVARYYEAQLTSANGIIWLLTVDGAGVLAIDSAMQDALNARDEWVILTQRHGTGLWVLDERFRSPFGGRQSSYGYRSRGY